MKGFIKVENLFVGEYEFVNCSNINSISVDVQTRQPSIIMCGAKPDQYIITAESVDKIMQLIEEAQNEQK